MTKRAQLQRSERWTPNGCGLKPLRPHFFPQVQVMYTVFPINLSSIKNYKGSKKYCVLKNILEIIMLRKNIFFKLQKLLKHPFSFLSTIQLKEKVGPLTDEFQPHHDLIFIRHAESLFNQACEEYRKANSIPYIWKELLQHQGFNEAVLYNPNYMDCPLTEKGRNECQKTLKFLENLKINCVVVSPQLRALQTCQNIFERYHDLPVFVEPLLVGPLRSCCDVNRPTIIKRAMFPRFDFTQTEQYQQLWYLDYLTERQKKICEDHFRENNVECIDEQRVEIVRLMKSSRVYEDAYSFRRRVNQIKNLLVKYRSKYQKVAVVTHYYTIQYITAMDYRQDGSPQYYIDIKNCKPYFAALNDLLPIKEEQL